MPDDTQLGFNLDAGDIPPERLAAYEVDYTPRPVVRQGLVAVREHFRPAVEHFFDPSAGAGVFGSECRSIWPSAWRVGIEPRDEEAVALAINYDAFTIQRFDSEALAGPLLGSAIDLIATNPPFSHFHEFVSLCLRVLRRHGLLVLLGLNELGSRGAKSREIWRECPPWLQLRIAGTIQFRVGINPATGKPYTCDQRSYSWWVWRADGHGGALASGDGRGGWRTMDLPLLPAAQRRWDVRPGTEALPR